MDAILRIIYQDRIAEFDLSEPKSISEGVFSAFFSNGSWMFSATSPVTYNGKSAKEGRLSLGDAVVIDAQRRIAALVIKKPAKNPKSVALCDGLTIGRGEKNSIELRDRLVSSAHCAIQLKSDGVYVCDLGSSNGIFVNNKRVKTARVGKDDIITAGCYKIKIDGAVTVINADSSVVLHAREAEIKEDVKKYPYFSPAPRPVPPITPINITIESAPAIGDNPSFGMPGLALSAQMIAISLGMQTLRFVLSKHKYSKQERQRAEVYANYLAEVEAQLEEHSKLQRERSLFLHPSVNKCMQRVEGDFDGLWSRHPGDVDFLTLRLGLGQVPLAANVNIPQNHVRLTTDELDDVPRQLKEKYAFVDKAPIFCDIMHEGNLAVSAPRNLGIDFVRSLVAQISALHNYNDVKIVALFPEEEKSQWEWMRWLPHCMSNDRNVRFMLCGKNDGEILEALDKIVKERMESQNQWQFGKQSVGIPHYIFVVANPELLAGTAVGTALMMNKPELGVSGIFLGTRPTDFPHSVRSFAELSGSAEKLCVTYRKDGEEAMLKTHEHNIELGAYEKFARSMAPIRILDGTSAARALPSTVTLFEGLGISDLKQLDLGDYWNNSYPEESLSVPIGVKANGEKFLFDIHQTAHGPHGMVAGGTGSGKSQMAQTWITSMAMQFSPRDVNFVLVDFKGESLLQPFEKLPHLAGSISNLDKDVARSFVALESELERRQKLLADFGCNDIIAYIKKRRTSPFMPEMPYIILVIDEFAEFKLQFPDFTRSLDHLYRGGRSLGLFVVIMTQAPSGVVTDQMKANAAFRWCLAVKSESDSREMLGTTEATAIRMPGRAYVKSGDTYELIQSFFAGAPLEKKKTAVSTGHVYSVALNGERMRFGGETKKVHGQICEIDAVVKCINDYCRENKIPSAKPLWRKELPERVDMFSLPEQGDSWNPENGWKANTAEGPEAVIGIVDDPAHQEQFSLVHNFRRDGHLAVYGMPVSGKTTFLQTVCASLVNKYSPNDVWIYSIDIGGFGLRALETFPHVGMAAGDDEPEVISKMVSLLEKEIDRRKKLFRAVGAGSPAAYAEASGKALPSVVVLVDNLNQAGNSLPDFNAFAAKLAREGASYGVYLVCTFTGSVGASYQITQSIKSVYSLCLADKTDYNSIVGRPGNSVPNGSVGQGLVKAAPAPLLFQTAVPFEDLSDSKRIAKLRKDADEMKRIYKGELPTAVKSVPERIEFGSVDGERYILGMDTEELKTISLDEQRNVSLLISDGAGTKSDVLRCIFRQAAQEKDAKIWVYTSDAGSYSDIIGEHTLLTCPKELDSAVEPIAQLLRERQTALREKGKAEFKPVVIILDNLYNITKECSGETVARLEVFIRLGKQLGLFVAAADTAENAGKCRFAGDILTATMREGAILLAGGAISSHQIADIYTLRDKYPQPLNEDEAVLINTSNSHVKLKRMRGE